LKKVPVTVSAKFKRAIARATIEQGSGDLRINSMPLDVYGTELNRQRIEEVLALAGDLTDDVDMKIRVEGGGISGQTSAIRTSIARGLIRWTQDPELRKRFLEYDRSVVKGDVRRKEPKKPGRRGARARPQKSYR
jgi:small subunit ribosomal protein S9